ncbi:hypothetical protein PFICI_09725 [Pestalotiopsis fici W106-1]|uniref:Uncharacterized protein n=1 Tax=Pestalotiopsis fici (strain W106-1 / CGMCC3.15140) TaxID=1229662 RepID=W3WUW6_PESFW|nr:uncharacterized protein PFICI_09725 [Pestalotiopsis fici W106-1]ETS77663.1 hypothetical protein PFICI_09725 [Pestalotiopsis fici W106-1]
MANQRSPATKPTKEDRGKREPDDDEDDDDDSDGDGPVSLMSLMDAAQRAQDREANKLFDFSDEDDEDDADDADDADAGGGQSNTAEEPTSAPQPTMTEDVAASKRNSDMPALGEGQAEIVEKKKKKVTFADKAINDVTANDDSDASSSSLNNPDAKKRPKMVLHLSISNGERMPEKREEPINADDARDIPSEDPRWPPVIKDVLNLMALDDAQISRGIRRAYQHQHVGTTAAERMSVMPPGQNDRYDIHEKYFVFTHEYMHRHHRGSKRFRVRLHHLSGTQVMMMAKYEYSVGAPTYFTDEDILIKDIIAFPNIDLSENVESKDGVKLLRLSPEQIVEIDDSLYYMGPERRKSLSVADINEAHSAMVSLVRKGLPNDVRDNIIKNIRACNPQDTVSATTAWKGWKKMWIGKEMVALTLIQYEIIRCFSFGHEPPIVKDAIKRFNLEFYRQCQFFFSDLMPIDLTAYGGHGTAHNNELVTLPARATKLDKFMNAEKNGQSSLTSSPNNGGGNNKDGDDADDEGQTMVDNALPSSKTTTVKKQVVEGTLHGHNCDGYAAINDKIDNRFGRFEEMLKNQRSMPGNQLPDDEDQGREDRRRIAQLEAQLEVANKSHEAQLEAANKNHEAQLEAANKNHMAQLETVNKNLEDERKRAEIGERERNKLKTELANERQQSNRYYRIDKRYLKTASAGIAALVTWKYTPMIARAGARWSAPRLERLGQWLAETAVDGVDHQNVDA